MWKPHHDTAHGQSHRKTQLYSDWINQEYYSTSKPARTGNVNSFIQQLHKSEPGEISIISISCPPKRSPKTSRNPEISPCTSRRRSLTTLVGSGFVITAQVSKSWLSVRVN